MATIKAKKAEGKRVLVTGSGTGIGREIALEFAREGADVAFHYGRSADGATSAVEKAGKLGVKARAFQADFSKIDDVQNLGNQALDFLGGMDILVNNAGITMNRPFFEVEPAQFQKLYAVNIQAQFFLTQIITRNMIENHHGGAVCNLTSIHGISGAPEHSVYAGTKGAIIAYTRSLAVELAHQGIRVNAIAPGWVTVENFFNVIPGFNLEDAKKAAYDTVPCARYGLPIDIAKLAVFLTSDDAGYIIGQTIVADGGTSSLMSLLSDFRKKSEVRFGVGYV